MAVTRRDFLTRAAAVGGASLVYEGMTGLGLLAAPTQTRFDLAGRVSGVRVLVLGAGLAGLTRFPGRRCAGAAAPGGRKRPRHMKRSRCSGNPTAGCTSPAIT